MDTDLYADSILSNSCITSTTTAIIYSETAKSKSVEAKFNLKEKMV